MLSLKELPLLLIMRTIGVLLRLEKEEGYENT
jgi:hypothetical protein